MKVWVSCYVVHARVPLRYYRLHFREPEWHDETRVVSLDHWRSSGWHAIARTAVEEILGDNAPEPDELLEIDLKPVETWTRP